MGVLKQSVTELCDTFDYCLVSQPFRKSDKQKRADGNQSEFRVLRPCDDNWRFFPIEFLCASSYATIKRIDIIVVYFHQDLRHRTARKSFRNYFINKKFLSETFALYRRIAQWYKIVELSFLLLKLPRKNDVTRLDVIIIRYFNRFWSPTSERAETTIRICFGPKNLIILAARIRTYLVRRKN